MKIQVVIGKSAKPTPEFLILKIPSGNRNKKKRLPVPLAPPTPSSSPAPSTYWQRGKVFYPKISDLLDYFAKDPLYCKHFPSGTVPEAAVSRITNILHFLFIFCFKLLFERKKKKTKNCKESRLRENSPKTLGYCSHLKTCELFI